MRTSRTWLISAMAVLALPALAQDRPPPASTTTPVPTTPIVASPVSEARPPATTPGFGESETGTTTVSAADLPPPPKPVELPEHARRDPWVVGRLDSVKLGLGASPWGMASGAFLSGLMRRTETPIASRWAHIAVRNVLLARAKAPRNVNPSTGRGAAWLLLRLGEADAGRMLVSGVDVDQFTPKMFQVAVQSALANADPAGLCPLLGGVRKVEPRVYPLIDAMCASLSGEPESAAAQIDAARRRGRIGGIDLVLAQKVVGAGADTGRAVTVEWERCSNSPAGDVGLASATGMTLPIVC